MSIAEREVILTHPINSVKNVARLMKKHDVRRLPITDAGTGRLEGLATAMDILDFLGGGEKYNIIVKDYRSNFPSAINCPIKKIMRPASFVEPDATVDDVVRMMMENHTSAIPIVEDDKGKKVIAIVTERDVLSKVDSVGIQVQDVMRKDIITSSKGMMISDVSKIMVRNGFRRLPVIEEEKLVGLVTVFDVLEFIGYGEFHHVDAEEALSERVEEIMSREVITVDRDQDISYVMNLVEGTGHGGFPVAEDGKLLGLVTVSDMIRAIYGMS